MTTSTMHQAVTANDKAAILMLIDSRHRADPRATEFQSRDLTIWMKGNSAFSRGLVRLWGMHAGWDHPAPFWIRETMCFERKPEGWRIVDEHTSAPFHMDHVDPTGSIANSTLRIGWAAGDLAPQPCS